MSHRKIIIWVALVMAAVAIPAILVSVRLHRKHQPITLRGAVIKQNSDSRNQSPISGVEISAAENMARSSSLSDFTGSFALGLRPGVEVGKPITLTFRHPDFQTLTVKETVGDQLYVVRLVPLHGDLEAQLNEAEVVVGNIMVRYSTEMTTTENIGSGLKTFQVVNTGNVPCFKRAPCSPDGKWKASVGSASLDAGEGNDFRNARVICIAGPCPFTRVDSDAFSRGGRNISVTVRNWSDSTTFLLQAEVFRPEVGDIVRESNPVIFGRAMNFTLPANAEGQSIEAELNGSRIIFPLGPNPVLSWTVCNVRVEKNESKDYRCELRAGYRFR